MHDNQCDMIFDRVADARRVNRKLRRYNILSRVSPRDCSRKPELHIMVPTTMTSQQCWELARKIYLGVE